MKLRYFIGYGEDSGSMLVLSGRKEIYAISSFLHSFPYMRTKRLNGTEILFDGKEDGICGLRFFQNGEYELMNEAILRVMEKEIKGLDLSNMR